MQRHKQDTERSGFPYGVCNIAPELLQLSKRPEKVLAPYSDMWDLGVCLYNFAAGTYLGPVPILTMAKWAEHDKLKRTNVLQKEMHKKLEEKITTQHIKVVLKMLLSPAVGTERAMHKIPTELDYADLVNYKRSERTYDDIKNYLVSRNLWFHDMQPLEKMVGLETDGSQPVITEEHVAAMRKVLESRE